MTVRRDAAAAAVAAAVFAGLAVAVSTSSVRGDHRIEHLALGNRSNSVVAATIGFSHYFGGWKGQLLVAAVVVAALALLGRRRDAAFVGAAVLVVALGPPLKLAFRRPPPVDLVTERYSFPSGHALGTMALALAVAYVCFRTRWGWPLIAVGIAYVAAVGLAVVAAGGHWPTDVLGAWALAIAWVAAVRAIFGRLGLIRDIAARDGAGHPDPVIAPGPGPGG